MSVLAAFDGAALLLVVTAWALALLAWIRSNDG